jgi:hypothetical protein
VRDPTPHGGGLARRLGNSRAALVGAVTERMAGEAPGAGLARSGTVSRGKAIETLPSKIHRHWLMSLPAAQLSSAATLHLLPALLIGLGRQRSLASTGLQKNLAGSLLRHCSSLRRHRGS